MKSRPVDCFLFALPVVLVAATFACQQDRDQLRIDHVLSSTNPCDVKQIAWMVATSGRDDQKVRAERAQAACDKSVYEQRCDLLASHVDTNGVTSEDLAWLAGASAAPDAGAKTSDVVQRVMSHRLSVANLGLSKSDLLCNDKLWLALVRTLARTPSIWSLNSAGAQASGSGLAFAVSDDMMASLVLKTAGLTPDVIAAAGARVEATAKAMIGDADGSDLGAAKKLCDQVGLLGAPAGTECTKLRKRFAAAQRKEAAVAERARRGELAVAERTAEPDEKQQKRAYMSCITRCEATRSGDQAQNETDCVNGCGPNDSSCMADCLHSAGGSPDTASCRSDCLSRYPLGPY